MHLYVTVKNDQDFIIYKLKILSNILIYKYILKMSFTRFHDDPARIQKANIENTHMNEYVFNVPGNGKGMKSQYFSDPRIRLQHTGVSMQKDLIGLENSLRNMGTPLNKDHINKTTTKHALSFNPIRKDVYENVITSESRATHPAFEYREKTISS